MSDYLHGLGALIWLGIMSFIAVVLLFIFGIIYFIFIPKSIKSDKPIQPKIELIIENNTVDTVYIYKEE